MPFLLLALSASAEKIKLSVVTENASSLQYKSETTDEMQGPAAELVEKVISAAHIDFTTRVLPWARAYNEAERLPNTLIYSIVRTPERESKFHWLGILSKPQYYLFAMKDSKFSKSNNINIYKNHSVGTILDSASHLKLKAEGFSYIVPLTQAEQVMGMLTKKRVDFITANINAIQSLCKFHTVECDDIIAIAPLCTSKDGFLYFAINKNSNLKLVNTLKNKYKELLEKGEISIF